MAGPAIQRLTAPQYLELERKAGTKHEFYNGQMYAMAGASRHHDRIVFNITVALGSALRNSNCQGHTADLRVLVESSGLFTYPDASISCGEPAFLDHHFDTLTNPKVIFEVFSKTSERYDRGEKFQLYQQCETITDIVFLAQNRLYVEHFHRGSAGNWEYRPMSSPHDRIALQDIGIELPLDGLYENVQFPTSQSIRSEDE